MKKILWFASWYPNRTKPFSGDFIERHAQAVSVRNQVQVLFVGKDDFISSPARPFTETRKYNEYSGATIRYYKGLFPPGKIESLISGIRYFFIFKKMIDNSIREYGKPDIIHLHICFRAGLLALFCKYRYKIPYIVSEHWGVFSPDAEGAFDKKPLLLKWIIKQIYQRAAGHIAVSAQLAQALKKRFNIPLPAVIPNVVDTAKFYPGAHSHTVFRFIHISTLSYPKNVEQIIDAMAILKGKTTIPFELIVYGPIKNNMSKLAEAKDLSSLIEFRGEVDHEEIALQIRHSGALLLYSKSETFGCVVAESLVSGVPPIVSNIASMKELVEDLENGIIVPIDRPDILAEKMRWMIMNRYRFNGEIISANAGKKYSINVVAEQFDQYYEWMLRLGKD